MNCAELFKIDNDNTQPLICMRTKYFIKLNDYEQLTAHIINILSQALIKAHENGYDTYNMIIDMSDTLIKNVDIGYFRTMIQFMYELFPDKLERCEIHNAPPYLPYVFGMIKPFMQKTTREKIFIVKNGQSQIIDSLNTSWRY